MKSEQKPAALIRNVVEVPWQEFPGHFGGALSKALVRPETAGSRLIDYRISMEMDGRRQVVRKHDVIYIPPGVEHGICNTGLTDLTFIVDTTPAQDD